MNNRLKQIRKSLNLTQDAFGKKISIARSHISSLENGTRILTNRTLDDLCKEYNVNEEWLRTGKGEMFLKTDNTIIDQLVSAYNLDDASRKILETFLELTDTQRKAIHDYFIAISSKLSDTSAPNPKTQEKSL